MKFTVEMTKQEVERWLKFKEQEDEEERENNDLWIIMLNIRDAINNNNGKYTIDNIHKLNRVFQIMAKYNI